MPHVAALYRYPVKSFTPETPETLTITADGKVAGDRVLGFRFADTPEADDAWSSKHGMIALVNTPGIARLRLRFDDAAQRLAITLDGATFADEALDDDGRRRLCDAIAEYVLALPEGPLAGHPERLPLRLVGDGRTPRLTDRPDGYVTLHGRDSLSALAYALNDADVSEVRFRSNVAVEGLEPWQEQEWIGKTLRIGDVPFRAHAPVVRCLATHANPQTGVRDHQVMTTLTHAFEQEKPTFAIALIPEAPGVIRLGDEVVLD
jgi:uncharacterized protein YcbX